MRVGNRTKHSGFAVKLPAHSLKHGGKRERVAADMSLLGLLSHIGDLGPASKLGWLRLFAFSWSCQNVLRHRENNNNLFRKTEFCKSHCKLECLGPPKTVY